MPDNVKDIIYSRNVVEFVTVSREYCAYLEKLENIEKPVFVDRSMKLLSLLYLKSLLLPEIEEIFDEELEKHVTEFDYEFIKKGIEQVLGDDDSYLDFFDNDMHETPEPVSCSLAENMADVYQDVKDFLAIYQQGIDKLMLDAIFVCKQSFENYWGYRIVNSLRIFHYLQFNPTAIKEDHEDSTENNRGIKADPSAWFHPKSQKE
jgi:hypothetical protein